MDNHRAALWCWLQEVDLIAGHSLIHIDRHTDTLGSNLQEWLKRLPDWNGSIEEYLSADYVMSGIRFSTITWDNYLSIYLSQFGKNIKTLRFLTHGDGDLPDHQGTMFSPPWDLPDNLAHWLDERAAPWIVNVDLDYFYCGMDSEPKIMVSDAYLDATFKGLKDAMARGVVSVFTLCLTPDSFTAGWDSTEELASRILRILGMDFALPQQ